MMCCVSGGRQAGCTWEHDGDSGDSYLAGGGAGNNYNPQLAGNYNDIRDSLLSQLEDQ